MYYLVEQKHNKKRYEVIGIAEILVEAIKIADNYMSNHDPNSFKTRIREISKEEYFEKYACSMTYII